MAEPRVDGASLTPSGKTTVADAGLYDRGVIGARHGVGWIFCMRVPGGSFVRLQEYEQLTSHLGPVPWGRSERLIGNVATTISHTNPLVRAG